VFLFPNEGTFLSASGCFIILQIQFAFVLEQGQGARISLSVKTAWISSALIILSFVRRACFIRVRSKTLWISLALEKFSSLLRKTIFALKGFSN